jgi:carbon monoxide dehydrogenase subunit G
MTTFESDIKKIACNDSEIFSLLSDLNNIEKIKDKIPQEQIKDLEFDSDSCRFRVDPVGQVGLVIVEREPFKTIKFTAEESPIAFNLWIQLKQVEENDTRLKVTVKADINPMLKMMLSKPMESFVNKMADMISQLPYREMAE